MEKKKWQNVDIYKWRKTVTLTPKEGIAMEEIYAQFGCENISQFCKKIVYGEIAFPQQNENGNSENISVLKAKLARYERIIANLKNELNT